MGRFARICLSILALGVAVPALAQTTTIKTPPLSNSDSFVLNVDTHIPNGNPPHFGWAGAVFKGHILDNTELDVVAIHSPFFGTPVGTSAVISGSSTLFSPFGPPSGNVQSAPITINYFVPTASGQNVSTSFTFGIASITVHAKNTAPANNSDIDASVMLWNLWHVRSGFSSPLVFLFPSDLVWVPSSITNQTQLHAGGSFYTFPPGSIPIGDPNAHWLHLTDSAAFAVTTNGSAFFATFVQKINVGIEHVPEPATGGLLAGGLLALAASRRVRRRRLEA